MYQMNDQHCLIFNWNVRGLNSTARREVVRKYVQDMRSMVVCLQETKMSTLDAAVVNEALGSHFKENFAVLPADGTRGGILIATHKDFYRIKNAVVREHSVTVQLEATMSQEEWWMTSVYGPQEDNEKIEFLREIRQIQQVVGERWLVLGDFNMILHDQDKNTANLNRRTMGAFRKAVNDLALREIPLQGRKYTWSNDSTLTRIDRAFCSNEWELMFPQCMLLAMSSSVSDHSPLILVGNSEKKVYKGFRFESFWPRVDGYQDIIQQAWSQPTNEYNRFLNLHIKLERTGKALRKWARSKIGHNKLLL